MSTRFNHGVAVAELLYPRAAANHLSKLAEFENAQEDELMAIADSYERPVDIANAAADMVDDQGILAARLTHDLGILKLMLTDNESQCVAIDQSLGLRFGQTDANQKKDGTSEQTLDFYLANGVSVSIDTDQKHTTLEVASADMRDVPLIEKIKAERVITANKFENSRVLHLLHDVIDHIWLFSHLRQEGVFSKYQDFLESVDFGERAFLYSRQAELFSTVGFGSRRWPLIQQNPHNTLSINEIKAILADGEDVRTEEASQTLDSMSDIESEWCISIIENMAIQIADERRRWGSIKQTTSEGVRPMHLLDPIYMAMLIDSVRSLQPTEQLFRFLKVQFGVSAILQDYFVNALKTPELISEDNIRGDEATLLAPPIISDRDTEWLHSRLYFSASYLKTN